MTDRELTPVFDGAKRLPDKVGWYPCREKYIVHDEARRKEHNQKIWPRRYFDGKEFHLPCRLHASKKQAEFCKTAKALFRNHELYWCGLTAPYKP